MSPAPVRAIASNDIARVNVHACCRNCAHFSSDPLALESAIPGLRSFGSGFAAVRDADGLCSKHGRYLSGNATCEEFARRD